MEDVVRRQEVRAQEMVKRLVEEDAEFHRLLARTTHNTVVVRVMEVIDNLLKDEYARWFWSVERPKNSLEGNRRILEAVRRRAIKQLHKGAAEQHIQEIARGY